MRSRLSYIIVSVFYARSTSLPFCAPSPLTAAHLVPRATSTPKTSTRRWCSSKQRVERSPTLSLSFSALHFSPWIPWLDVGGGYRAELLNYWAFAERFDERGKRKKERERERERVKADPSHVVRLKTSARNNGCMESGCQRRCCLPILPPSTLRTYAKDRTGQVRVRVCIGAWHGVGGRWGGAVITSNKSR